MTQNKQFYTSPEADVLVVRFEENFMGTGTDPNAFTPGGGGSYGGGSTNNNGDF